MELIKAEIERRKKRWMFDDLPISIGKYYEDRDLLAFIDSLPEEDNSMKEQIKSEIEHELVEGSLIPIQVDDWLNDFEKEEAVMWLEWCESVDYLSYLSIARHFAEWGAKHLKK